MTSSSNQKYRQRREAWKQQALRTWEILTEEAPHGTICYKEFSEKLLGRSAPRACSKPLGLVLDFCRSVGLPPLSAVVVSKKSRRPSNLAPYNPASVSDEIKQVLAADWNKPELARIDDLSHWIDQKYGL